MAPSASKQEFTDDEVYCLRTLRRKPIYDGTVRLILYRLDEPEKLLESLRPRGLVTKRNRSWVLTEKGEAAADEVIAELERQKPKEHDQIGYVGAGRRVHLLRVSKRDRGKRGKHYAICGADTYKSTTHPLRKVKADQPLVEQVNCPRCIAVIKADAKRGKASE